MLLGLLITFVYIAFIWLVFFKLKLLKFSMAWGIVSVAFAYESQIDGENTTVAMYKAELAGAFSISDAYQQVIRPLSLLTRTRGIRSGQTARPSIGRSAP